jgi:hypothetical protein
MAQLRAEVQQMIAQLNAGSREKVAGMGADSREKVAGIGADSRVEVANINQTGANDRHATASGSVIENNRGAMERLRKNIDFGYDKVFAEQGGMNYRHNTASGNATLGAQTARRGQDVGASTARRGQDLTFKLGGQRDATTQRGQDNTFKLGTDRNKILKSKAKSIYDTPVDFGAPSGAEPPDDVNLPVETQAPTRAPIPVTPRGGGAAPLPTTENVSDGDLDTLAKSILDSQGIASTPANIKTFKDRNKDALIQQIKTVRRGGG